MSSFQGASLVFNIMHGWRAMNDMHLLAPRYQGHSLSVQCYDFYTLSVTNLNVVQAIHPSKGNNFESDISL
jgi:hypothetical protein